MDEYIEAPALMKKSSVLKELELEQEKMKLEKQEEKNSPKKDVILEIQTNLMQIRPYQK